MRPARALAGVACATHTSNTQPGMQFNMQCYLLTIVKPEASVRVPEAPLLAKVSKAAVTDTQAYTLPHTHFPCRAACVVSAGVFVVQFAEHCMPHMHLPSHTCAHLLACRISQCSTTVVLLSLGCVWCPSWDRPTGHTASPGQPRFT